ncbi:MAG: formate/nitrite transporter family protein [Candidatus Rokuibacteriota bacterium]
MSYVKPDAVLEEMVLAGTAKARLAVTDLLVRGFLAGALLGFATTLAFTASLQTHVGLTGALVFPAGFVMIVLLGLELVTGNFAVLPLALRERRIRLGGLLGNWGLVFAGNLAGSLFYAWLFTLTLAPDSEMARQLVAVAEAKTLGYAKLGIHGALVAVAKAVLCNWMVTLGVVMALTSRSTGGKIAAMWLPVLTFFAQGFEHSVVNMFAIPAGMMMGAGVGAGDWWIWNQIPVTVGNIVGGALFTGMALHLTHRKRAAPAAEAVAPMHGEMAAGR